MHCFKDYPSLVLTAGVWITHSLAIAVMWKKVVSNTVLVVRNRPPSRGDPVPDAGMDIPDQVTKMMAPEADILPGLARFSATCVLL
eukprot:1668658-Amphidinium_carterae.1